MADKLVKDLYAMEKSGDKWVISGIRANKKIEIARELSPFEIDKKHHPECS